MSLKKTLSLIPAVLLSVGMPFVLSDQTMAQDRPKIGLALAGGGAAGLAHVGVIREMEALGLRPDCVTGTSMGSIVAGLYAAGYTPDELEAVVREVDWSSILNDASDRALIHPVRRDSRTDPFSSQARLPIGVSENGLNLAGGFVDGVKLGLLLRDLTDRATGIDDFDRLPLPFRAVAADLETGEAIALRRGDLAEAIRASMSIPGLFAPVTLNGRILVDGGIANNLPIDVTKELCGDIVIAVNLPAPDPDPASLTTLTGTLAQTLALFLQKGTTAQLNLLEEQDLLIEPDVSEIGVLSFDRAVEAMEVGADAIKGEVAERILEIARDFGSDRLDTNIPVESQTDMISYDSIVIENDSKLDDRVILARLGLPASGTIEPLELRTRLSRVYGLDLFETVNYRLARNPSHTDLVVIASSKRAGTIEARVGLLLEDDFEGEGNFSVGFGTSFTQLTPIGTRLDIDAAVGSTTGIRVRGEQPLDWAQTWFLRPTFAYSALTVPLFPEPDNRIAEFRVETGEARLDAIWVPGDHAAFGASIGVVASRADILTGNSQLIQEAGLSSSYEFGNRVGLLFDFDDLDDPDLPTTGSELLLQVSLDPLADSNESAGELDIDFLSASSLGQYTIAPFVVASGEIDSGSEIAQPHFLGGFQRLSGYNNNELIGAVATVGGIRFYRRFPYDSLFGGEVFAGISVEAGNVWRDWDDISVQDMETAGSIFTGIETSFGPLVAAFGFGENDQFAGHLSLGRRF